MINSLAASEQGWEGRQARTIPSPCVLSVNFEGHRAKPLTGLTGVRQKGDPDLGSSPGLLQGQEMMLFIGNRFSNLCTAVDTPA
jgi:hypothetical protein